jgi:hypothetical protein
LNKLVDGDIADLKFGKVGGSDAPGTGGKYATEFYKSLNAEEKAKFIKALRLLLEEQISSNKYMDAYNRSQAIAREEFDGDPDLLIKDLRQAATTLHPDVLDAIARDRPYSCARTYR